MKKYLYLLLALVLLGISGKSYGQLSGDYYIPQGGNLQGFVSLAAAITSLNTNGCSGTVNFLIDDNLSETGANLVITNNTLNTTNNLVIKPAPTKTPTITISGCTNIAVVSQYSGLTINGANYITIDGSNNGTSSQNMTIVLDDATNGKHTLKIYGNADNISVENLIIKPRNLSGTDGSGIMAQGSSSASIDNLLIQNCSIGSTTIADCPFYGIQLYAENSYGHKSPIIQNNVIYGKLRGVRLNKGVDASSEVKILNNTIGTTQGNAGSYAIELLNLASAYSTNGAITIAQNKINTIISNSGNLAVGVYGSSIGSSTLVIVNNVIGGNISTVASTTGVYGLNWGSTVTATIYNNTFLINSTGNLTINETSCIKIVGTITFQNNIVVNQKSSGYCIINNLTNSNYNNLYVSDGKIGKISTVDYTTLSTWQTASGKDANSVSKAVVFESATDLHVKGMSQGDFDLAGTSIPTVTTDIDGNSRVGLTYPYMGADENVNVPLVPYKRSVDGDATDWTGTASGTLHASVVSNEEAIYKGETEDCRTDQHGGGVGVEKDNDLTEVRYTRDDSFLYFMFKVNDLQDVNRSYIAITMDKDQSDDAPVWIGDDSPVSLSPATNRGWERQLALHTTTLDNSDIELFADDGGSWYGPLSNYLVQANTTNNVIEARIALYDLNLSKTDNVLFTFSTFNNVLGFNNVANATTASYIDAVTPGYSGSKNAYFRVGGDVTMSEGGNENFNANVNWVQSLNPLPVELASFTASASNGIVTLNWSTATELNAYLFEVQRSDDINNWITVGDVNASGNSNSIKNYSFIDETAVSGKYYYRLKQIDNDGAFEFLGSVEVDLTTPMNYAISQNYPNPFNPVTRINYSIPVNARVTINVYSLTGELVKALVDEQVDAGNYSVDFDGSQLASGTYFYRIIANDFVQTKKMVLIK